MNIECKSYADFPFHAVLAGDSKVLDGWIEQLMAVAEIDDVNKDLLKSYSQTTDTKSKPSDNPTATKAIN